jgi:hypothetical protein
VTSGGHEEGVRVRRITSLALIAVVGMLGGPLLDRWSDRRNIGALARHVGCSRETAEQLYLLARQQGYGSASARVLPDGPISGTRPS